jgi:hypothetical protein
LLRIVARATQNTQSHAGGIKRRGQIMTSHPGGFRPNWTENTLFPTSSERSFESGSPSTATPLKQHAKNALSLSFFDKNRIVAHVPLSPCSDNTKLLTPEGSRAYSPPKW